MLADDVPDDELLYRSVRPEHFKRLPGIPRSVSSQAFSECRLQISVDCARLVGFDPDRSRLSPEESIVILIARDVRKQGPIEYDSPNQAHHTGNYDVLGWVNRTRLD